MIINIKRPSPSILNAPKKNKDDGFPDDSKNKDENNSLKYNDEEM